MYIYVYIYGAVRWQARAFMAVASMLGGGEAGVTGGGAGIAALALAGTQFTCFTSTKVQQLPLCCGGRMCFCTSKASVLSH
jgi:hypothetical protein